MFLGGIQLVGLEFQFFFEIDDFQARARTRRREGGEGGVHPVKSYQFFSEIDDFPGARVKISI